MGNLFFRSSLGSYRIPFYDTPSDNPLSKLNGSRLDASLARYDVKENGLSEVLWGAITIQLLDVLSTSFLSAQAPLRISALRALQTRFRASE